MLDQVGEQYCHTSPTVGNVSELIYMMTFGVTQFHVCERKSRENSNVATGTCVASFGHERKLCGSPEILEELRIAVSHSLERKK